MGEGIRGGKGKGGEWRKIHSSIKTIKKENRCDNSLVTSISEVIIVLESGKQLLSLHFPTKVRNFCQIHK